jgi:uncharacterized protein DUF4189
MTTNSTPSNSALRRRISAAATVLVTAGALAVAALGPAALANAIPPGPPTPPPNPGPQYVAIAFSPDNGDHGWASSNGSGNSQMAQNGALGNCRSASAGADQCQIVVVAQSAGLLQNGCAALMVEPPASTSDNKWGPVHVGKGASVDEAENAAAAAGFGNATGIPLTARCAIGDDGIGAPSAVGCAPDLCRPPSNPVQEPPIARLPGVNNAPPAAGS